MKTKTTETDLPTPAPEQAHTQEPWDWAHSGQNMATNYSQPFGIHSGGAQLVGGLFGDVKGGKEQAKANAERIVACVNALAGLNPSALPDVVKILEELVEHIGCSDERQLLKCDIDPHPPSVFSVLADNARAALASLKGAK